MAEAIGVASGLLALATFAFHSSITLHGTIHSFQSHPKRVRDLTDELEALSGVLGPLRETLQSSPDIDLSSLDVPLLRCGNACNEFQDELLKCSSRSDNSRVSFRDWAKLRYMGDDIDSFRRLLAGYKLTITIALTDATLWVYDSVNHQIRSSSNLVSRNSTATAENIESYKSLVETATDDLQVHLESINEKLERVLGRRETDPSSGSTELSQMKEEISSTQRCLQICDQLSERISQIQLTPRETKTSGLQTTKHGLISTASEFQRRLQDLKNRMSKSLPQAPNGGEQTPESEMKDEIERLEQCLEICNDAVEDLDLNRMNHFENVSVAKDGHQINVTTLSDLISAKNIKAGFRSTKMLGQISDASLQELSTKWSPDTLKNSLQPESGFVQKLARSCSAEYRSLALREDLAHTLTDKIDLASTYRCQDEQAKAEELKLLQASTLFGTKIQNFALELRHWPLLKEYLESEFDTSWHLDDIVVLVSDEENTWCTTCKNYIEWRWGAFGVDVLVFLNSVLTISQNKSFSLDTEVVQETTFSHMSTFICIAGSDAVIPQLDSNSETPSVMVEGLLQAAQEVAKIIGWVFDSLRLPKTYGKIVHGDESVVVRFEAETVYGVAALGARDCLWSESNCWRPLFPRRVVSVGRIPERPADMKGLEIEYSLLVAITGVDLPAIEDRGIYLDGYRSALYPILKDVQSQSLQWHLRTVDPPQPTGDENEDSDDDHPNSKSAPLVWYQTLVLNDLIGAKRHFVGWCTTAIVTLGTSMQNPANLEWSDAKCHKRSVVETTTNLNLNLSFHGVGASAGRSYKRGRNERNPYENYEENLRTALINARKSQILLLRPSTEQAWLVPKTSVLLQLVHSYMAYLMTEESLLSLPIHYATASHDGGQNAYQALWNHRNEIIPLDAAQSPCHLFNVVRMFLFALEKLAKPCKAGEVCGWEMKDLIDPPELFDLKKQGFCRRQLPWFGGWNQLLPEMCLVLYFEGLKDPIVADQDEGCAECTEMPQGKHLLGITMLSLKNLTRRFRSKYLNGGGKLTEGCYWSSPNPPFGTRYSQDHRCNAIQRIIKNSSCNPPRPDELKLGERGAVIFEPCALSYEETHFRGL